MFVPQGERMVDAINQIREAGAAELASRLGLFVHPGEVSFHTIKDGKRGYEWLPNPIANLSPEEAVILEETVQSRHGNLRVWGKVRTFAVSNMIKTGRIIPAFTEIPGSPTRSTSRETEAPDDIDYMEVVEYDSSESEFDPDSDYSACHDTDGYETEISEEEGLKQSSEPVHYDLHQPVGVRGARKAPVGSANLKGSDVTSRLLVTSVPASTGKNAIFYNTIDGMVNDEMKSIKEVFLKDCDRGFEVMKQQLWDIASKEATEIAQGEIRDHKRTIKQLEVECEEWRRKSENWEAKCKKLEDQNKSTKKLLRNILSTT